MINIQVFRRVVHGLETFEVKVNGVLASTHLSKEGALSRMYELQRNIGRGESIVTDKTGDKDKGETGR